MNEFQCMFTLSATIVLTVFQVLKVKQRQQRLGFHTPTPIHTVIVIVFSEHCQCVWKELSACSLNVATVVLTSVVSSTEAETAETAFLHTRTLAHTHTHNRSTHAHYGSSVFSTACVNTSSNAAANAHIDADRNSSPELTEKNDACPSMKLTPNNDHLEYEVAM